MTPEAVEQLVAETPMPPGYILHVTPQRQHKYRALWSVRVLDKDGNRLWGRAFYAVAHGILEAQHWAWLDAGVAVMA